MSRAALDEGFRFVAAVGNDATVQDVVNGMFRDGRPIVEEPVLGVVAAGGCDLSLSFGLPRDVAGAVGHLTGENTYPFDVMKIAVTVSGGEREIRYAHNMAEVGFHAAATIAAGSADERHANLRRFLGFWRAYVRTSAQPLTIATDRKTIETRAWSVVIGNGQFTDGGIRLSPRSSSLPA